MIKDIVANLSLRDFPDVAVISPFPWPLLQRPPCGEAFTYDPIIPVMIDMYGIPPE